MTALQRRQQIGRIHACKSTLTLSEPDYRELLTGLTGLDSTKDMDDRQVNHVLDWMNFLAGAFTHHKVNRRGGVQHPRDEHQDQRNLKVLEIMPRIPLQSVKDAAQRRALFLGYLSHKDKFQYN